MKIYLIIISVIFIYQSSADLHKVNNYDEYEPKKYLKGAYYISAVVMMFLGGFSMYHLSFQ